MTNSITTRFQVETLVSTLKDGNDTVKVDLEQILKGIEDSGQSFKQILGPELESQALAALEASISRQEKAAETQPEMSPQEIRNRLRAVRILQQKGHTEAAQVIAGKVAPDNLIAALQAAMNDHEVPGGIRHSRIKPILNEFAEKEVIDLLTRFMREVDEAARLVPSEKALLPHQAFQGQAALRRASKVRFGGHHMAAIERMMISDKLPLAIFPTLQAAIPKALEEEPRTRTRALLNGLTDPLWDRVNPVIEQAKAQRTGQDNPKSGFTGRTTGKTARKRALKKASRKGG